MSNEMVALTELVANLKTNRSKELRRFDSWRDEKPEDLSSLSYGDLKPLAKDAVATDLDFYMPDLMTGSDYAGDSVTVSNYRTFLEDFGKVEGVFKVYGGLGTYAVAVRLNAITPEMLEVFNGLQDYPLISEEDHSEVEMEAQEEAWGSWVKHDFTRELTSKFPEFEEAIENMEEDNLSRLFYSLADRANEYWENQTGNSAYIRVAEIVAVATEDDITR